MPCVGGNAETHMFLLSGSFFLIFSAYSAAQSLAGSLPSPEGLEQVTFAVVYGLFGSTAVLAPTVVYWLGPKMTMCLGSLPYAGLVLAFLSPNACEGDSGGDCWPPGNLWALRCTMAALVGAGAGMLWTGEGVYLPQLAAWALQEAEESEPLESAVAAEERGALRSSLLPQPDDAMDGVVTEAAGATAALLKRYNSIFFAFNAGAGSFGLLLSSFILIYFNSVDLLFVVLAGCAVAGATLLFVSTPKKVSLGKKNAGGSNAGQEPKVTFAQTLALCREVRLLFMIPTIVYNGITLGILFNSVNALIWKTYLGLSFVGFGSAWFYTVNTVATIAFGRLAAQRGQAPVFIAAAVLQLGSFLMILFGGEVPHARCDPAGCAPGSAGSCWRVPGFKDLTDFPLGCNATAPLGGPNSCAECAPYDAQRGQACSATWEQCEWLHGSAVAPRATVVTTMFVGTALFSMGDAVLESQVPAVLQTTFPPRLHGTAIANFRIWQSIGVASGFGLATLEDLSLSVSVCLGALVLSSASLLVLHMRVVSLDGVPRGWFDGKRPL